MDNSHVPPVVQEKDIPPERNLREVIRFPSDEECRKALQVLIDLHEHHRFNIYRDPNEWWIYTNTLRKLRQHGVQFQWLTENI
jgi:hypothetical protein